MRVICVFFSNSNPRAHAFAEACYRLSPDICLRGAEAVFIEISRCRTLYSEESALLKVQALLKRFSVNASISIADDIPTALVFARFNAKSPHALPLSCLRDYADPFDVDEKAVQVIHRMIEALERLGLATLQDFKSLPGKSLPSRFGVIGKLCWDRVVNPVAAQAIPFLRWKPAVRILEFEELLETEYCAGLEPLLFKSKELLERLVARLRGRGERVTRLLLELHLDKHSQVKKPKREWRFDFMLPQGSVMGIVLILRERLARALSDSPLESEVQSITFEAVETAPSQGAQTNFFHQREEKEEAMHSLVDRIAEKLGASQVFQARTTECYLPEGSWERHKIDPQSKSPNATLPFGARPLRLFPLPRPIARLGSYLKDQSSRWKIINVAGPERISGEWWERDYFRDYYRVETDSGEALWIFKDRLGALFLHGIFE